MSLKYCSLKPVTREEPCFPPTLEALGRLCQTCSVKVAFLVQFFTKYNYDYEKPCSNAYWSTEAVVDSLYLSIKELI